MRYTVCWPYSEFSLYIHWRTLCFSDVEHVDASIMVNYDIDLEGLDADPYVSSGEP